VLRFRPRHSPTHTVLHAIIFTAVVWGIVAVRHCSKLTYRTCYESVQTLSEISCPFAYHTDDPSPQGPPSAVASSFDGATPRSHGLTSPEAQDEQPRVRPLCVTCTAELESDLMEFRRRRHDHDPTRIQQIHYYSPTSIPSISTLVKYIS